MKAIYITLAIILLSLAIEVTAFKPIDFEEARRLHAHYNEIQNKRESLLLKEMVAEKHGAEFAHHIAQMPYDERKLWGWNPFKGIKKVYNNVKKTTVATVNKGANFVKKSVDNHVKAVKNTVNNVKNSAVSTINKVKKSAVSLYQKAQIASHFVAPIVSATMRDVKKEMSKAKHVLDSTVNKINHELKKVPSAVTKGVDQALKQTMRDLKYTTESVNKAIKKASPKLHAAASAYVKDIQKQAKKVGGLVVSVGKKMYQVTMVALEAAKKFVNDKLLPWLKEHIKPIWESAKKKALKQLKSQTGIDTTKEFNLKFDMSKFTAKVIAEGMKNVAIKTAKDSAMEFLKKIPSQLPWLATTLGIASAVNAPLCIGAASITIATAGVGSPSIAACAMGIVGTLSPPIYTKMTAMGLSIALIQAPKILGRLAGEFCPKMISGNGAMLVCKGLSKLATFDPRKGLKSLTKYAIKTSLKGKRRRAQQCNSKRRRLSVLTASHD